MKNKNKQPNLINMNYKFMAAPHTFVEALIFPVIASFLFAIFASVLGALGGVGYEELMQSPIMLYGTLLLTPFVFATIVFRYSKKNKVNMPFATGLNKTLEPSKVMIVILMSFVVVFMVAPFIGLVDHLFALLGFAPDGSLPIDLNNGWQLLVGVLVLAVAPAVVEELLFRGIILNALLTKLKPHVAVLLSAIMFMLMHGSLQQTVYQILLGLVFGYIFVYTRKIAYSMILHFFNNLIVIIGAYMSVNSTVASVATTYVGVWDYVVPVAWLLFALVLVLGGLILLRYGSFTRYLLIKKNKPKKAMVIEKDVLVVNEKTENSNMSMVIEMKTKPKTWKNLKSGEKQLLIFGLSLGVVFWLINTVLMIFA